MITDEMLQAAAGEVAACMDISLSTHPEHLFSPRFRRKMNRLIFKTDHPIQHNLSTCAAILALALTFFATLLTLSPTVRATVFGWLKLPYKGGTSYTYEGQPPTPHFDYTLTNLPEGYELEDFWELDWGKVYFYRAADGAILNFQYTYGTNDATMYLDTQDYVHDYAMVGNENADIYIPQNNTEASVVVWTDSATGALLTVVYDAECEELINLAEGIKILEKN